MTRKSSEIDVTLPYMQIDHSVKHHGEGFMSKKRHAFWVEFFQKEGISPFDAAEKKDVSPFANPHFQGGEFGATQKGSYPHTHRLCTVRLVIVVPMTFATPIRDTVDGTVKRMGLINITKALYADRPDDTKLVYPRDKAAKVPPPLPEPNEVKFESPTGISADELVGSKQGTQSDALATAITVR